MGIITTRLLELYRLRARVDQEIRLEERAEALRSKAAEQPVKLSKQTRVSADTVRRWARATGIPVGERGRVKEDVWAAYFKAHRD